MKTVTAPHIRWMIRSDMQEVLEIERNTSICYWDEEDFRQSLKAPMTITLVAQLGEKVVGYVVYKLHERHLQIIKLSVDPFFWRAGIGSALIEKLKSKLTLKRVALTAVVHERWTKEQCFLRKNGFLCTRIKRDYFRDGDGYRFVYRIK